MKNMYIVMSLLFLFLIAGCNNQTKEEVNAKEEPKKEIVKFESVEDAEAYLWEGAKESKSYSEIEKIIADNSFVSESDYDKVVNWYKELVRINEIVRAQHKDLADSEVEDLMFIKKDGGIITRSRSNETGGFKGYELEFISEDDTYKLEKLTMLQ